MKLKACPTIPGAKLTPPVGVPLFVPAMSKKFPSPGHQATRPAGGGMHCPEPSGKTTKLTVSVTLA